MATNLFFSWAPAFPLQATDRNMHTLLLRIAQPPPVETQPLIIAINELANDLLTLRKNNNSCLEATTFTRYKIRIETLLKRDSTIINAPGIYHCPLDCAAMIACPPLIELLIKNGAYSASALGYLNRLEDDLGKPSTAASDASEQLSADPDCTIFFKNAPFEECRKLLLATCQSAQPAEPHLAIKLFNTLSLSWDALFK